VEPETKEDDVSERDGDDPDDDDAAAAAESHDGRDGEIKLFFDGKAPERADGTEPAVVKDVEVPEQKREGEDGASRDGGTPVIEVTEEIASEENEEVERPYPQDAADRECA